MKGMIAGIKHIMKIKENNEPITVNTTAVYPLPFNSILCPGSTDRIVV